MALLYFWRHDNYRRDLDYGVGFHLNQRSATLHDIELGDSLWAFTRGPGGGYALAAELVATAKTYNQQGYRYGRCRLWGDLRRSRYFQVEGQPDLAPLIRRFSIRTGVADGMLGRAFQGQAAVRRISEFESQSLRNWASTLSLEPRARLVPEERLEALLISEDPAAVADLLQSEAPGVAEERLAYLRGTATVRNRGLVKELNAIYDGRCQICELHARNEFGVELCEAHHLQWLSRGGEDEISNLVLLCPTHHRAVHRADAPFDWSRDAFVLPHRVLPLALKSHDLSQS
jgi:5-methylcytosine-specific restriction protein A